MTTRASRQRPNFQRHTAATSAVRVTIVGVADSMVTIRLPETPACWRYSASRLGTSASHFAIAVDGSTSVTRYPDATMKTTRQAAGTRSHRTSRMMPPTCERTYLKYPPALALTPWAGSGEPAGHQA